MENAKQFVLWGSSGHAKVLHEIIKSQNGSVVAIFDNNKDATSVLPGVPIFYGVDGFAKWMMSCNSPLEYCGVLAIGGASGKDRHELSVLFSNAGLTIPNIIHSSAAVSATASIGRGTHILANSVVAADAFLGDVCIINNSANVDHECVLGNGVHIAPGVTLCGCVSVGDNSMIGAGAVVLPRISIGRNVVVGAGSVVIDNIPDNSIVAGNPAKLIRKLND